MSGEEVAAGELGVAGLGRGERGARRERSRGTHIAAMEPLAGVCGEVSGDRETCWQPTGAEMAVEVGRAGELCGAVWTELGLGEDRDVALVGAHLGDGAVLAVFDAGIPGLGAEFVAVHGRGESVRRRSGRENTGVALYLAMSISFTRPTPL